MTEQSGGGFSQFFIAEVRDIRDPDRSGKVKIVVHGHHNAGDEQIPDEDLPWAHPIMNNSPSINKIGQTSNYLPGSTVIGFWMDPETKQMPVILGSFHRSGISED